ncbi:MAG: hypothetical protein ABJN36_11190 [Cyclobacteriaceae bacterium]
MKTSIYIMLTLLSLGVIFSCGEDESLESIGDPVFYVLVPDTAPESAFPNRELSFPVEVQAEAGLEKVELKMDYQTLDGFTQTSFETEKGGTYNFSYTPVDEDIDQTLEFVIVAYDKKGYTYDVTYSLQVIKEPVNIIFTFPGDLPTSAEVEDEIAFNIQITSEDALAKVETILDDTVLDDLTAESFDDPFVTSYSFSYTVAAADAGKNITFTYRVTDVDLKKDEATFTIFVEAPREAEPINIYTDVVMGMQSNTTDKQFIDLSTATVYTIHEGYENSELVDIGTFRSGSSGINLFGPIYSNAAQFIYTEGGYGDSWLGNWSTRNNTEARRIAPEVMSAAVFDGITDDDELIFEAFKASEPSVEDVTGVDVGDIIVFKTVDEEYAAIKVTAAAMASSGSVTFDLKVTK